jgi:hypothetical protein
MVGHDGGGVDQPGARVNLVVDGFQKRGCCEGGGEGLDGAALCAAGDEKDGAADIELKRGMVGQGLSASVHGWIFWQTGFRKEPQK